MPRVVSFTPDLMFSSSIEETLRHHGKEVATVEDLASLERELGTGEVEAVVLDLHAGVEAGTVVMLCQPLGVPVLAYGRHTEAALLRSAREAGCAEVVARSTLVQEMPRLVEGLTRG